MKSVLEKTTEKWLGDQVKKLGGGWLKFTSPGHSGVPDRILILKGHMVFVEMKRSDGTLSPIQKATFAQIVKWGASVHVVYGKPGAEQLLEEIKSPASFVLDDGGLCDVYEWR